eukprot:scaffold14801_cov105-Isochrysis_galbana.AAC.10
MRYSCCCPRALRGRRPAAPPLPPPRAPRPFPTPLAPPAPSSPTAAAVEVHRPGPPVLPFPLLAPLPLPPPTSSVPACTPGFRPLRPLPPPPPAAAALAVSTSVPPLPRSISGLGSPLWVAAGPGLFVRVAWPALPLERDGASDPAAAAFCPHLDCEGVEAPNCETAAAPTAAKAPPPMPPPPSPSPAPPPAALAERGRRLPPRCPRACCFATACGVPGGSSAASLPSP